MDIYLFIYFFFLGGGGSSQNWTSFRDHFYAFKVFSVSVQNGDIFGGC